MKLYIPRCPYCQTKINLSFSAADRPTLRYLYGQNFYIKCAACQNTLVTSPENIYAEKTTNAAAGGGVLGGLVGLLGGPIGLLIGAGLGAALGNTNDEEDRQKVNRFNQSY